MKRILISCFTLSLFACGTDYKAEYDTTKNEYLEKNQTELKACMDNVQFFQSEFEAIDSVYPAVKHKEHELSFTDFSNKLDFNTLYLDCSYLKGSAEYHLEYHRYLDDVNRLLEKEELSFYEPASAVLSLDYLKDFLEFCDALLELDYILIKGDLETQYPVYAQDGTFVPGKTTGMVALFDFDSKNMIDNFVYEVESSESVSSLTTQSPDDVLLSDFLNQISTYISAEVQARYTVDPAVELPFFTNTDSEVLR